MIEIIVCLAVLGLFIREPGCGLALVCVIALVGVGIWHFAVKLPREQQERRDAAVTVSVRYDTVACNDRKREFPLRVEIANRADLAVQSVRWTFHVTEPGHSTNLAIGFEHGKSDLVLRPGQETWGCWALPEGVAGRRDAARLVYEVGYREVAF